MRLNGGGFTPTRTLLAWIAGALGILLILTVQVCGPVVAQAQTLIPTTTTVTSSPNPSNYGQSVTFTATVGAGGANPTGTVQFYDGSVLLGTAGFNNGKGQFVTSFLTQGVHSVTASYSGDTSCAGSVSLPLAHTVVAGTRGPTSTTIVSSENPSRFGTSVTFTATVFSIQGIPAGTVRFLKGSTILGSGKLDARGTAFTAANLPAGSHSIVATYDGDANYAESTSPVLLQVVQPPPKIPTATIVASSANPSPSGQPLILTATVTGSGGPPTGSVLFTIDGSWIQTGRLSAGATSVQYGQFPPGAHEVVARYTGDDRFEASVSPVLTQIVDEPVLLATAVTVASSSNPSTWGQTVTFTATVSAGGSTPTGTVQFFDSAALLATVSLNGGSAQFGTSALAAGSHSITAVYGGDSGHWGSTSPILAQVVKVPPGALTSTTVTASANPSTAGEAVTFTATVTSGAGTGTPAGAVQFLDGTNLLGTSVLSGGQAVFNTSSLTVGAHLIIAKYGGDSSHEASTSPALLITVLLPDSRPLLTSSANPSARGQAVTFEAQIDPVCGGTVTFLDGAVWAGTALPDSDHRYRLTLTQLTVGVHRIVAVYAGGAVCPVSTSNTLEQVVLPAGTATVISVARTPAGSGGNFVLTAATQVIPPGGGKPAGEVVFQDGATVLGRSNLDQAGLATLVVNLDPAVLHGIAARYSGDVNFAASSSVRLTDLTDLAKPDFEAAYVGNSASFTPGLSVNSFATIFGSRLSGGVTATGTPPYVTMLQGVQVILNGRPVQLVYVGDQQINFIVPSDAANGMAQLVITTQRGISNPVAVPVVAASPGIFADPFSGYGAILIAGTADTTQTRPARAGDYIEIYCTGLGAVDPDGRTLLPATVTIGGLRLSPPFSGMNPIYPGLYQVNVQIPPGLSGQQRLSIEINGRTSNEVFLRIN